MISLKVYNGEVFERNIRWYIGFFAVIVTILGLSIFYKSGDGVNGLVGAFILLMIVGGYLFFLAKANGQTELILKPEGLTVGARLIPYTHIKGFVVEMDKTTGSLKNIVLVYERSFEIFTLNDTKEQQELFFEEFSKIVPFLESYEQSNLEKLIRKLKL